MVAMRNIAVVGSRSFSDLEKVKMILDRLYGEIGPFRLVSGGAAGVDDTAEAWAKIRQLETNIFPADWENGGRKAGIVRNSLIVNAAEIVIAFWDGVSPGTLDTIVKAKKKKDCKVQVYLG